MSNALTEFLARGRCPWCNADLMRGETLIVLRDGVLVGLTNSNTIGKQDYVWTHGIDGCRVLNLMRIPPNISVMH